jgi:hypothetical protein
VEDYKLFYAQTLYKAGQHHAALAATSSITSPDYIDRVSFTFLLLFKLVASPISFTSGELDACLTKLFQL